MVRAELWCLLCCLPQQFVAQAVDLTWWRHQMGTFSALLALCAGNSPVTGVFPSQRPVTRSFDIFFDLRLNKRLNKHSWRWWFDTPSCPLLRHCNALILNAMKLLSNLTVYNDRRSCVIMLLGSQHDEHHSFASCPRQIASKKYSYIKLLWMHMYYCVSALSALLYMWHSLDLCSLLVLQLLLTIYHKYGNKCHQINTIQFKSAYHLCGFVFEWKYDIPFKLFGLVSSICSV